MEGEESGAGVDWACGDEGSDRVTGVEEKDEVGVVGHGDTAAGLCVRGDGE